VAGAAVVPGDVHGGFQQPLPAVRRSTGRQYRV
jgi:hypothetical protein